jgi:hypothetical protein
MKLSVATLKAPVTLIDDYMENRFELRKFKIQDNISMEDYVRTQMPYRITSLAEIYEWCLKNKDKRTSDGIIMNTNQDLLKHGRAGSDEGRSAILKEYLKTSVDLSNLKLISSNDTSWIYSVKELNTGLSVKVTVTLTELKGWDVHRHYRPLTWEEKGKFQGEKEPWEDDIEFRYDYKFELDDDAAINKYTKSLGIDEKIAKFKQVGQPSKLSSTKRK